MNTDRVSLTTEQAAFIAAQIARDATKDASTDSMVPCGARQPILPLYVGWIETIGILPDGRVRRFSADDQYEGLRVVDEVPMFICALLEGAQRYPQLRSIVPARPEGAVTCEACHGTGKLLSFVCGECGGVGWQP